jgi:hypothetical protein
MNDNDVFKEQARSTQKELQKIQSFSMQICEEKECEIEKLESILFTKENIINQLQFDLENLDKEKEE